MAKHAYDQAQMDRLEKTITLPDRIKCDVCKKWVPLARYSRKQLHDARLVIQAKGAHAHYKIRCKPCVGGPIMEIECSMCNKTKGLEEFAKSQRKKTDCARCYACVEDQLALDPVQDDIYNDPAKAFEPADHSAGNCPEYWAPSSSATNESEASEYDDIDADDSVGGISLSDNFRNMSMNSSADETLIESEFDLGSQNGQDGWNVVQAKSWHTKTTVTPSASSGFNPNKYGKPSSRATPASVAGSARTFSSGLAERSDTTSYKNGWARIKAYDPKKDGPQPKPAEPSVEEWSSSEDEDEDDADDSGDDTETEI